MYSKIFIVFILSFLLKVKSDSDDTYSLANEIRKNIKGYVFLRHRAWIT